MHPAGSIKIFQQSRRIRAESSTFPSQVRSCPFARRLLTEADGMGSLAVHRDLLSLPLGICPGR